MEFKCGCCGTVSKATSWDTCIHVVIPVCQFSPNTSRRQRMMLPTAWFPAYPMSNPDAAPDFGLPRIKLLGAFGE